MKKLWKLGIFCMVLFGGFSLINQNRMLKQGLIRLHIVAHSDSQAEQAVKLQVRDEVTAYLARNMENMADVQEAKAWLRAHLSDLETLTNETLAREGFSH